MNPLTELFTGRYYVVPRNQRGFSWEIRHLNELLTDLEMAGKNSHYMGPIIVSRTERKDFQDDSLVTTAEFTLEDGQQRLTTFLIIVSKLKNAIQERAGSQPSIDALDLERLMYFDHNGRRLRIQNENRSLHDYLSFILTGLPDRPEARTPPMAAMDRIAGAVEARLKNYSRAQLLSMKNLVTNKAKFVWVNLSDEGIDRYLAFDAINSRGLPLSEFDKIKNFAILIESRRGIRIKADESWYGAISKLESMGVSSRSDEAAFIAELYSAYVKEKQSQGQIHTSFTKRYEKLLTDVEVELVSHVENFIGLWEPFAKSWSYIATKHNEIIPQGECTAAAVEWLRKLDRMQLPTITRVLLAASHMRYGLDEFEAIARACEIFTFRIYAVSRYRKDKYSVNINSIAHEVLMGGKRSDWVIGQLCRMMKTDASLKSCIADLTDEKPKYYYDQQFKGWAYSYYFLYEYEVYCSPKSVPPIHWQPTREGRMSSIEHILPQAHRDGGWWEQHWSDEAEADNYKHRLGNLVLTENNSTLGRKPIHDKLRDTAAQHCYTHVSATNSEKRIREFTDGSEWRPLNILRREFEMLKFFVERWSIPCAGDVGELSLPGNYADYSDEFAPIVISGEGAIEECVELEDAINMREDEEGEEQGDDATQDEVVQI
jgi:hypothetical protein